MLTDAEKKFVQRQLKSKQLFLYFSIIGVVVAVAYLIFAVIRGSFDGKTFVLVILILLQARANLKQHKGASILDKLCGKK